MIGVRWQAPDQTRENDTAVTEKMRDDLACKLMDSVSGTLRTYQQDRQIPSQEPAIGFSTGWETFAPFEAAEFLQDEADVAAYRKAMRQETPVLMSATNPDGWKLEELLDQVRAEVLAKNEKLSCSAEYGIDPASTRRMMVRATVRELNERISVLLMQAALIQREIQAELAAIGPDQGPRGTARV